MRTIELLAVCCLSFIILIACGEKKITVKGADGTEYESYQECCAAQDFQAAHQFLAKIHNTEEARENFIEAKEYVFKQEALYLMSIGDEDAKKRLIYLLKEGGENDEHVNLLMDIAIDNKDEAFVKTLANQYKSEINKGVLRKIIECLYLKNDDSNLDYLSTLLKRYNCSELLLDAASEKGEEETVISLASQFNEKMDLSVFKKVMDFLSSRNNKHFQELFTTLSSKLSDDGDQFLKYAIEKKQTKTVQEIIKSKINSYNNETIIALASLNNNNISIILLEKLSSYENDIPKRPNSGTFVQESCYALENECDEYAEKVKNYNEKCIDLLNISIKAKNRFLANKAVAKVKPNLSYNRMANSVQKTVKEKKWYGDVSSVEKWDKMIISGTTNRDDIKSAQNTLNEAVRSGAFK